MHISIKRGGFFYIVLVIVVAFLAGVAFYTGLTWSQKVFFELSGDALYHGYLTSILPIFLGGIVCLSGVVVGRGMSEGKIKPTWRILVLYILVACGVFIWLTPGALFNFLKVSSGGEVVVSDASWTHRSIHQETYDDILYAVDGGPHIYFRDGVIFKGISNFKDFADRYKLKTGKSVKIYYNTTNGIQPTPDSAE